MQNQAIIDLTQYRIKKTIPKIKRVTTKTSKGSVFKRSNKLWVDFRYLGERVREPSGLSDTKPHRKTLRKQLVVTSLFFRSLSKKTSKWP